MERTLVFSLIAAAGVVIVTWPLRLFSGTPGAAWSSANLDFTLSAALIGFGVAFVVLLGRAALRVPSLLAIARRADRDLNEKQRLSTAFEVIARHGDAPDSIVQRRLLAEVEERLSTLNLGSAVRRPIPRAAYSTLAALTITASVALAVPVPLLDRSEPVDAATPPTTVTSEAPSGLTPESVDETIALAETIAEQLAAEPLAERDPFLRAVADGFADLASQLSEESISVAEADQIIEDLLAYLDDAVERSGSSLQDVVQEAMPEGIDRGRGEDSNATIPSLGGEATEEDGRTAAEVNDQRPQDSTASQGEGSALERLANALEERAAERAASELEGESELFGGDGSNPYGDQVNVVRESSDDGGQGDEPLLRAGAEAAGAGRAAGEAQQSSAGAGDAAGAGSAELTGESADFERDDAQVDLTPVEGGDQEDGRRIESDFAPAEGLGRERLVTDEPAARAFDRTAESGTPSHTVGWIHRDVVARYFLPVAAEPPESSE